MSGQRDTRYSDSAIREDVLSPPIQINGGVLVVIKQESSEKNECVVSTGSESDASTKQKVEYSEMTPVEEMCETHDFTDPNMSSGKISEDRLNAVIIKTENETVELSLEEMSEFKMEDVTDNLLTDNLLQDEGTCNDKNACVNTDTSDLQINTAATEEVTEGQSDAQDSDDKIQNLTNDVFEKNSNSMNDDISSFIVVKNETVNESLCGGQDNDCSMDGISGGMFDKYDKVNQTDISNLQIKTENESKSLFDELNDGSNVSNLTKSYDSSVKQSNEVNMESVNVNNSCLQMSIKTENVIDITESTSDEQSIYNKMVDSAAGSVYSGFIAENIYSDMYNLNSTCDVKTENITDKVPDKNCTLEENVHVLSHEQSEIPTVSHISSTNNAGMENVQSVLEGMKQEVVKDHTYTEIVDSQHKDGAGSPNEVDVGSQEMEEENDEVTVLAEWNVEQEEEACTRRDEKITNLGSNSRGNVCVSMYDMCAYTEIICLALQTSAVAQFVAHQLCRGCRFYPQPSHTKDIKMVQASLLLGAQQYESRAMNQNWSVQCQYNVPK